MASRALIITSVLVVVIGYALYTPLPDGIAEPWKLQIVMATLKIMHATTYIGEKLGIESRLNLTRTAFSYLISSRNRDDRVQVEDRSFDGVMVRIYRPKTAADEVLPGLVYFHGGGWALFSVDSYDPLTSYIAAEAHIAVVSVEYRLAPEHPFPIPFDDCVTATVHLLRNAKNYKINPQKIGVAGDDAGGNLAAATANRLSFEVRLPPITFHAVLGPAVQSFDFNTPSMVTYGHVLPDVLTREMLVESWLYYYHSDSRQIEEFLVNNHTSSLLKMSEYSSYVSHSILPEPFRVALNPDRTPDNTKLAQQYEDFLLNPFANPLMALELISLPPAFILTSEFDPLRDDGFFYASRLVESNVAIVQKHYSSGFHGFIKYLNSPLEVDVTRTAVNDLIIYIKDMFIVTN